MAGGDYDHANNRRQHNFSARKIIINIVKSKKNYNKKLYTS